ncbi:MAG: hypothetical protein K9W43_04575 [Candidatus Thorarchaeota archaeon]|nr:hypothetical protein [Candidatus Thorarchaeota archaeon]
MAILDEKGIIPTEMRGTAPDTPNDIETALNKTGYHSCSFPNGFTFGVKFEGLHGTRGVHVDVVICLDLRVARFGASGLAMRAAVLETVNRTLDQILVDVGLGGLFQEQSVLTPRGKVRMPILRSPDGRSSSYVHETRNIYVITDGVRPSIDLSWLTDSKRIVPAAEFALLRNSDARAMLPVLTEKVTPDKWVALEHAVKTGWYSVIALVGVLVGLATLANSISFGVGTPLLPLLLTLSSLTAFLYLFRQSSADIQRFEGYCVVERQRLDVIGDKNRIDQALRENSSMLSIVGDLNFMISPLMASAAEQLRAADLDGAVSSACSILDECVRSSPSRISSDDALSSADEGLAKFLGLFESLGTPVEQERLALAYVAFTGYPVNTLTEAEVAEHIGILNNSLFDAGILRPQVKESVDDLLNAWAMKMAAMDLTRELEAETGSAEESPSETDEAATGDEELAVASEIVSAGLTEKDGPAIDEEMPVIEAEDA